VTSTVIATRGQRLTLIRANFSDRDRGPEAFHSEILALGEINADERITASVQFDVDDIDAAFEELDVRYLAGEAAPHAHTWSLITQSYAALNRRELPPTKPDWVNIDHRRGTSFAPGEMPALLGAAWNINTDLSNFIEAVHRLDNLGAVVINASHETSQEGFDAEWRVFTIVTFEGDLLSRCEVFDETDVDAALTRFDELHPQTPRLENAASQVGDRFSACFAARDWDAMAEMLAADYSADDRRRVVNAGIRHGRDTEIENFRAAADLGFTSFTSAVIATRGEHLVLSRLGSSVRDQQQETFRMEMFGVTEINADDRIAASVAFDLDDIEAAFEELDARYLAGEAAAHAHTWSVIAGLCTALNRRELPTTTPGWVNIDHRRATAFAPGEAIASLRAHWDDLMPDFSTHIEGVHRLNNVGAVVTFSARGTSQEGFDAEWREIAIFTFDGDLLSRCELFDEADLDAALARFDELSRPAPLC
jgi:hypothetical protein